jgi:hypothetical protein
VIGFSVALFALAIFGVLSEPTTPYAPTRKQLRAWRRDRLRLPRNNNRLGGNTW